MRIMGEYSILNKENSNIIDRYRVTFNSDIIKDLMVKIKSDSSLIRHISYTTDYRDEKELRIVKLIGRNWDAYGEYFNAFEVYELTDSAYKLYLLLHSLLHSDYVSAQEIIDVNRENQIKLAQIEQKITTLKEKIAIDNNSDKIIKKVKSIVKLGEELKIHKKELLAEYYNEAASALNIEFMTTYNLQSIKDDIKESMEKINGCLDLLPSDLKRNIEVEIVETYPDGLAERTKKFNGKMKKIRR